MLRDLLEFLNEIRTRILSSRLSLLAALYVLMIMVLFSRLFNLQIIRGEDYLNNYIQKTEKTVTTPATRGNIYDRNGNLLAYNKLAYAVVIRDNGEYKNSADRNAMLYRLISILNAHGEQITGELQIGLTPEGEYVYTTGSEAARKRFLKDFYGLRSVDELDKNGKYPSDISAEELIGERYNTYKLYNIVDESGEPRKLSPEETLQLVNIKYSMSFTSYRKYDATRIASAVSEETKADILENAALLLGVDVEEENLRVYNDSIYFSSIIGYTGKVQENQLEELKKINEDYTLNDTVGRIGIEEYMESELQGKKGYRIINVDNVGHILNVKKEKEATAGNDVYLTIDRELQIGTYHLLEQQLAGILANKLALEDEPNTANTDSTSRRIPVKDAYFQLINNNVLSLSKFKADTASEIERGIYSKFLSYRERELSVLKSELLSSSPTAMNLLPEDRQAFMYYIYNKLAADSRGIIKKDLIDTGSDYYAAWKEDSISLREFLYEGIADNWIDTSGLNISGKYSDAEDIFAALVESVMEDLEKDEAFEKLCYKYLIKNNTVTGRELCLALYEQEILKYDSDEVALLSANAENYAFSFIVKKISDIELTPAQLALDPCTAGAVITDVNTGEVRALVSYPGYDSNRLTNTMDAEYYSRLINDQSLPLYNNATQARKAPGSTFKPITAIAALEEGVVGPNEKIVCTGLYDTIEPNIKCWVFPGSHGGLDIRGAIQNSCNYYFAEAAHRMSLNSLGESENRKGMETIQKYATLFGLDHKSGVEVVENEPLISTESPEQSAMGQGTHSFANVQLSRYVAAIANRGNVFELSILDKISDGKGNVIEDYTPKISSRVEIDESTWNYVQQGMRQVVEHGSASRIFSDLEVDIAGKTGTAQETKNRGNHAFFISFAPYANPEVAVSVNIPFGYSSSNAAAVAKDIYRLYFGYTSLDFVLNNGALDVTDVKIGD